MENKYVLGLALAVLFVFGAVFGALAFPRTIVETVPVPEPYEVIKEVPVEVIKEVPVEVIKEVPVDVITEVDNGKLDLVLEYLVDEDLFDDDDDIVGIIEFKAFLRDESESFVRDSFKSILDDEFDDGGILSDYRKSEVSIRKIESTIIDYFDFDDKDGEVELLFKLKAKREGFDTEYFDFIVYLPFEEGKLIEDEIDHEELI